MSQLNLELGEKAQLFLKCEKSVRETRSDALIPKQTGTDVLLQDRDRQPDKGGGITV